MTMRDGEHADDRQSRRDRHSARRCHQRAQHDNGKRDQQLAVRQRHVDDAERASYRHDQWECDGQIPTLSIASK